uniref:Major facilitator superfamily (MFS) profile domain-containing protein n=1 Tax=Chromera velia CCMP2878 TaxID=1169474 RepID=A0A0G4I566_9ALVE|eukprot:Cvel_11069.t1-p1 / transcript=Cvel_11069.t1 / gene=Cvel_11069 / organism=Chromera_velia_CCMP2878 / gene_product=Probable inorganic phosphate transporter 1-6, putative / transcript_product=Probable inorganic phosphate transporter 1-6, putative / location=Cvel_scaffold683:36750-41698(-) / protein_length=592 / sequence_SO=supercontig / SO=protein_coding / is_pseudo=false
MQSGQTQTRAPLFGSLSAFISSCLGIFVDLYFLTSINLTKDLFAEERGCALTSGEKAVISSCLFAGTVVGQVSFGLSADLLGRRAICIATSVLMFTAAFVSAFASSFTFLVSCLFFLGLAIGGEYPLSASMASESADPEKSARRTSVVYSMMGVGQVISPLVTFILLSSGLSAGYTWRGTMLLGTIPVLIAFVIRFRMQDSARFRAVRARRGGSSGSAESVGEMFRRHGWVLLGTSSTWLLYDIVTYGMGSFYGELSTKLGFGTSVLDEARSSLLLQTFCLPGYVLCICLLDLLGRKNTQMWGFFGMAAANGLLFIWLLWIEGALISSGETTGESVSLWIKGALLIAGRTMDGAFVGLATYVIPGEYFPTAMRATFHGISAGSGKIGAVIGSAVFPLLIEGSDEAPGFAFSAVVSMVGLACTIILIPNYSVSLLKERLLEEEAADARTLREFGGDTHASVGVLEEEGEGAGQEDGDEERGGATRGSGNALLSPTAAARSGARREVSKGSKDSVGVGIGAGGGSSSASVSVSDTAATVSERGGGVTAGDRETDRERANQQTVHETLREGSPYPNGGSVREVLYAESEREEEGP